MSSSSIQSIHNFKKIEDGAEFTVSAPGKVILHGEHSVVYGRLALAASLELRTKIQLVEIDLADTLVLKIVPLDFEQNFNLVEIQAQLLEHAPSFIDKNSDFNWWESSEILNQSQTLLEAVEASSIFKEFVNNKSILLNGAIIKAVKCMFYLLSGILLSAKISPKPMCIIVDSELSMGAGLGSSASFSVAFSALFIHYLKLKTNELKKKPPKSGFKLFSRRRDHKRDVTKFNKYELKDISNWAFTAEKIFHGTPSGIDNTVCTYGNVVRFRKNDSPAQLYVNLPLNFLLINTKVPRETKKMVEHVIDLRKAFPNVVESILDALEHVTLSADQIMLTIDEAAGDGDYEYVDRNCEIWGTLMHMNQCLLNSLGVSHEKFDEINSILAKFGLKGKLTGAGGGGYAIAVVPFTYDPGEVIRKLKEHHFDVVATVLAGQGVRLD